MPQRQPHTAFALTAISLALAAHAQAQVTIDQNKAIAGNITPGDAAGFPISLGLPGHYVLKSNLVVPAGVNGIEVTAAGVTLDLNGFAVVGPDTCSRNANTMAVSCTELTFGHGIEVKAPRTVVRNGSVSGFRGGISVTNLSDTTLSDITANENNYGGVNLMAARYGHQLIRVRAGGNGKVGIYVEGPSVVAESVANGNGWYGVQTAGKVVVSDSLTAANGISGLYLPTMDYSVSHTSIRGVKTVDNKVANIQGKPVSMGGNADGMTPF